MNSNRQTERKITHHRSKALKGMASARLPSSEFCQKLDYTLPNLINRAFKEIVTKHPHCYCSSPQWQQRAVTWELPGAGEEGYSFCRGVPGHPVSSAGSCAGPGAVQGAERRRFTLRRCRGGSARREAAAAPGSAGALAPEEPGCPQTLVAF